MKPHGKVNPMNTNEFTVFKKSEIKVKFSVSNEF